MKLKTSNNDNLKELNQLVFAEDIPIVHPSFVDAVQNGEPAMLSKTGFQIQIRDGLVGSNVKYNLRIIEASTEEFIDMHLSYDDMLVLYNLLSFVREHYANRYVMEDKETGTSLELYRKKTGMYLLTFKQNGKMANISGDFKLYREVMCALYWVLTTHAKEMDKFTSGEKKTPLILMTPDKILENIMNKKLSLEDKEFLGWLSDQGYELTKIDKKAVAAS